jgi:hypothetical protein
VIVPSTQRPAVLVALGGVIWLDYALLMWWLLQMSSDLGSLFEPGVAGRASPNVSMAVLVFIPSVVALMVLAPWAQFLIRRDGAREQVLMFLIPVLIAAYLASLPFAYRGLRRAGLPGGVWSVFLLVPVLHWLAVDRMLRPLHARVRERALQRNLPVSSETGAGSAAGAADVLLIIAALFWSLWVGLVLAGRGGVLLMSVQAASIAVGSLFAITQVAALEYLQRRFVALIRRAAPAGVPDILENGVEQT